MAETPDPITDLLHQTEQCQPVVREFAWVWLETYRRDAAEVLRAQSREGRSAAFVGGDVEAVRQRSEARLQAARERLLGRLQRLLAWAHESGRDHAGDEATSGTTPGAGE